MSTLAAILLMFFDDEVEAFAAMICIFENYQFNIWYANNLQGLNDSFVPFEKLVSIKLPDLHKHLRNSGWKWVLNIILVYFYQIGYWNFSIPHFLLICFYECGIFFF
eukprot:TRINITY_DN7330_c0_g3_i5.p1 TRINITY_DN7330_c0_g3~~TRINITY_DN7330_c0_g3_i5.p1  ORF type:complete len:107 (-),score=19.54 TRINITY_DN7330_c0_g3_i5:409-729(-)